MVSRFLVKHVYTCPRVHSFWIAEMQNVTSRNANTEYIAFARPGLPSTSKTREGEQSFRYDAAVFLRFANTGNSTGRAGNIRASQFAWLEIFYHFLAHYRDTILRTSESHCSISFLAMLFPISFSHHQHETSSRAYDAYDKTMRRAVQYDAFSRASLYTLRGDLLVPIKRVTKRVCYLMSRGDFLWRYNRINIYLI